MSAPFRLPGGGAWIKRESPLAFTFDGASYSGFEGDTLASALLASGVRLIGRSFKYHRPRGILASGFEEPNGLAGIGRGAHFKPNQRMTTAELYAHMDAVSQNRFPSLAFDLGAFGGLIGPMIPSGFYYKTFIHPRAFWKHLYEPAIRRMAGLGRPPDRADEDHYCHRYAFVDILVAGGGLAGLVAAYNAGKAGLQVMLVEQSAHLGGRTPCDAAPADETGSRGRNGGIAAQLASMEAALASMENVSIHRRTQLSALYDHGYALCYERVRDHLPPGEASQMPRHRLWRVRAQRVIVAAGAIERPLIFGDNDRPGVMLASALRDYAACYGVAAGKCGVIATNNDDAYRSAIALARAGVGIAAIVDARGTATGALPDLARAAGIRILTGAHVARVEGRRSPRGVCVVSGSGERLDSVPCDFVGMSGGWVPSVHLWSQAGGSLTWDEARALFHPNHARPPVGPDGAPLVRVVGAANGVFGPAGIIADAAGAAAELASALTGKPVTPEHVPETASDMPESPLLPVWSAPEGRKIGGKRFVDFQNDVTAPDIALAAREGYRSVEHTKRYTTLGMATDQGKTSNLNGLALLAEARGDAIPLVGTTRFRPPFTPVSFGAIAGNARGALFKPVRETAIHCWHKAQGADWEPVGDWRRPYCYRAPGESRQEAVAREITTTRNAVGILDASTLGKILVAGRDAAEFLDRLYTNMMSTLKAGHCRYGLMCNDNGFLMDDGVVARLDETRFLCHTTSGGADRVHGWMEEWLQTEWPDLQVHVVNQTEQFAQFALAGPKSRTLLRTLEGDLDLSPGALPFMRWTEGMLSGAPVRVFRISFSGELSFELATPAGFGRALWERLLQAGAPFGIAPYGTEALHVMRAEKGFIVVGDETDGTVTPHDLGLGWAVSRKKADFLGKRAMERTHLCAPGRLQLVGLLTENPADILPDGAQAIEEGKAIGHVTSSYASPTIGRAIAMALIAEGRRRMGDTLLFPLEDGRALRAVVSDPVFYDKEGARQNVS